MTRIVLVFVAAAWTLFAVGVLGSSSGTQEERAVLVAIERLSASTAPGGGGAEAYAAELSDDFSRWTVGSTTINRKSAWVEGIEDWFTDGWRVAERKSQNVEIKVSGDTAFTRRIVTETYVGPEGERSESSAALAEVWKKESDEERIRWRLFLVNVHPIPAKE